MVAAIERWHRPDGKLFLFPDDPWSPELAAAARQIADAAQRAVRAEADATSAAEIEALQAAGFVVARREARVRIPFAEAVGVLDGADLPPGIETISAIHADETRLRPLDDELRSDVPGTDGWRNDPGEFHSTTFAWEVFDPATYLVAVDVADDRFVGLVRIWLNRRYPRLGLVGVIKEYRRRGLARALLARVVPEAWTRTGAADFVAEYDEANAASATLLGSLGAEATGASVELVLPPWWERPGTV